MIMKKSVAILLLCFSGIFSVYAQTGTKPSGVEVLYFYGKHRCATCNAVEKVTKDALKQYYGDQLKLQLINREEEKNNALVNKYQVAGQTLIIVKGNKKEDLTNIAIMNAERSPYRLKTKIKETIDKM
jgi:hypothetical protein